MAFLEGRERWVKHYASFHRILLVGEGDFSFAWCLARSFGSALNIVATSLDSYEVVINKYRKGYSNLQNLQSLGATLIFGVDATKMKSSIHLGNRKFDRIVFNFPHAGFHGREDNPEVIKMHRELVDGFFCNAAEMLQPCGEVHVSHKTSTPYCDWNVEELAFRNSLGLLNSVNFKIDDYPGYGNKRGDGVNADNPFPLGECCTYKFVLNPVMNKLNHDIVQFNLRPKISSHGKELSSSFGFSYHQPRENVNQFGWLRFNVSVLAKGQPGLAGCGGVMADDDGNIRIMFSVPLGILEYDVAQLCAFKVALCRFLRSKLFGMKPILMRSDSVLAVSWITNPGIRPLHLLEHFIEIDSMLDTVSGIRVQLISSVDNGLAKKFAENAILGGAFEAEF